MNLMFYSLPRSIGGDFNPELSRKVEILFEQFGAAVEHEMSRKNLRRGEVRSMLQCNLVVVLDADHLFVAAQKQLGMASTDELSRRAQRFTSSEIEEMARWEFGFEEPFVIQFPADILDQDAKDFARVGAIEAVAHAHVQAEIQRTHREMNVIQINPIFGPASYTLDPRLAFVLMPFTDTLTDIYHNFVKPTVEVPEFGLVCRRADDIKSNRAIMHDIWKSICEARIIIADLTGLNPNVMYELGIAHTLGKETILIYQRGDEIRFPFDLSHIRRIEYENTAIGGRTLEQELRATLSGILSPHVRS